MAPAAETVSALPMIERRLSCYLRALWGRPVTLREADGPRVSIVEGAIRLPSRFPAGAGGGGLTLYRAAAAHAAAHLCHSTQRFSLAKLRPIQMALVSLIEDARIERLAWRDMPGLRRLWLPFHTARPAVIPNAVSLMARLARALIDSDYRDEDAWVAKGREMFEAQIECLRDPSISRTIGTLLGNDLGQMRLQFDVRGYLVEPAYRDDNTFLWDFPPDSSAPKVETAVLEGVSVAAEKVPCPHRVDTESDGTERRSSDLLEKRRKLRVAKCGPESQVRQQIRAELELGTSAGEGSELEEAIALVRVTPFFLRHVVPVSRIETVDRQELRLDRQEPA